MSQPVFPNERTTQRTVAFPLPEFMPRTRREVAPSDSINARQFEHWQTAGRYGVFNRPVLQQQAPFYDMAPSASRSNDRSFRSQPRMDPDADQGVQNPYFDKYDATTDSRNMTRELRASVYEDKNTGYKAESLSIMERNMESRWLLPVAQAQNAAVVDDLRPQMDDIRKVYHPLGKVDK